MHFPKWFWISFFAVAVFEIGLILFIALGFLEFNSTADVVILIITILSLHPFYMLASGLILLKQGHDGMSILKSVFVMITPIWLMLLVISVS